MKRRIGIATYAAISLIFVLPPQSYLHDILHSFAVQAIIGYGLLGLLASFFRRMLMTAASLGAALLIAGSLYLMQGESVNVTMANSYAEDTLVRVAHFNVLCSNQRFQETADSARATQADLLSFQEVSEDWGKQLKQLLSDEYPYFHIVTDAENASRGLAVFSKHPVEDVQTIYWDDMPNITGNVLLQGEAIHFIASHTLSPRNRGRYQQRNRHIRRIARYIKTIDRPVLAIGDYNVVPWNPVIRELTQATDLQHSHTGWQPTFPARFQGMGVPIDYIFHSPEFHCRKFKALPAAGSDHRGIVGEYLLNTEG
ncbi:endonuclease/exonuclease/phosphatase family protein [Tunicatimonas pelagia]|uniref:endonuclease/exonuclease/phosphatase family protein n=1 Tax=Tunicatimonas pelagia TaxID=931531 RepID=UPI0026652BBF|nr:endonuclease/exonuclease/phosphatase family protein [Tunicatimonas pelagia]WKN44770.1 endonuclease/exonuclease/phosphatase family protein [Tunicatimonas pelagia]